MKTTTEDIPGPPAASRSRRATLASSVAVVVLMALTLAGCGEDRPAQGDGGDDPEQRLAAAAEAFTGQGEGASGPVKIPPGIHRFFDELEQATRSPDARPPTDFFSVDGMVEALKAAGHLEGLGRSQLAAFRTGLEQGLENLGGTLAQMAFDRHRIVRVEDLDAGAKLVYVRLDDNELNITSYYRWWLMPESGSWKAFDFEEVELGWRFIEISGLLLKAMMGDQPEPWVEDFGSLVTTLQGLDMTDPESFVVMAPHLEQVRTHELPNEINRFVSVLTASTHLVEGDAEASLREIEAARSGGYSSALYHYQKGSALMMMEKYSEALEEFNAQAELLGWNSDLLEMVSEAHLMTGDRASARDAALRGLEDNPAATNCVAWLAAASTVEEIRVGDFNAYFAATGDPEWAYELTMDLLLELGHDEQAQALLWRLRGDFPKSHLVDYYLGVLRGASGRL